MLGVLSDPGIIPRTVQSLFKMISDEVNESTTNQSKPQHTVTFSYLEIYNEKVIFLPHCKTNFYLATIV